MQAARQIYPDISLEWARPRVNKPKSQAKQFEFSKFMFILVVIGCAAFTRVYQQALIAQNGIEIARIKNEIREETRIGKTLKIEKILLESPARLERLAVKDLGMVKPVTVTYITIPAKMVAKPNVGHVEDKKKGLDAVLARISFLVE